MVPNLPRDDVVRPHRQVVVLLGSRADTARSNCVRWVFNPDPTDESVKCNADVQTAFAKDNPDVKAGVQANVTEV